MKTIRRERYPLFVRLERRKRAVRMRQQGYTLQEIGDALGVTRERARQIIIAAQSTI